MGKELGLGLGIVFEVGGFSGIFEFWEYMLLDRLFGRSFVLVLLILGVLLGEGSLVVFFSLFDGFFELKVDSDWRIFRF